MYYSPVSLPEAMKAVEEEYAKLRERGAWDEKRVKERRTSKIVVLCEENSILPLPESLESSGW